MIKLPIYAGAGHYSWKFDTLKVRNYMQQIAGVYLYIILTVSDRIMSMIGNKRVATVRKPSPSRDDDAAEETFQSKLEEFK